MGCDGRERDGREQHGVGINPDYVVYCSRFRYAPVSQLVEEAASKSAQCGFESHRGHRFDEQPRTGISRRGFFVISHLTHVRVIHQLFRNLGIAAFRSKRLVLDCGHDCGQMGIFWPQS